MEPAQNRISPAGEVIAAPGRGAWMGNRGRLHEGLGSRVVVRHHQSRAWITCALSFRGWRAAQWEPRRYTPLFFLDEAVAFAAGHRPCAECRRAAYLAFRDAAARYLGEARLLAPDLDAVLHAQRWDRVRRAARVHEAEWREIPDGAFVLADSEPAVVHGDMLTVWRRDNSYGRSLPRPTQGPATVLSPPVTLAVLRAGYPVQIGVPAGEHV